MKALAILVLAGWLGICLYQQKIYLRGMTTTRAEHPTSYWALISTFTVVLIVLIALLLITSLRAVNWA
jgi:hypothetical protein